MDWNLQKHSVDRRKFSSIQDFVRELIRRDIEAYDKEQKESK